MSLLSLKRALSSAKMYLLIISGIVSALLGVLLIIIGVLQCRKRISFDDSFASAEGYVTGFESRLASASVNFIPVIVTREYAPYVKYMTDKGEWITSMLPFTLKISPVYRDYKRSFEHGTALDVHYNPENPTDCRYGSKRAFRIREVIYKFIVAVPLLLIGYALIWSHFNM